MQRDIHLRLSRNIGLIRLDSDVIGVNFCILQCRQGESGIIFVEVGDISKCKPIHLALNIDFLDLTDLSKNFLEFGLRNLFSHRKYIRRQIGSKDHILWYFIFVRIELGDLRALRLLFVGIGDGHVIFNYLVFPRFPSIYKASWN